MGKAKRIESGELHDILQEAAECIWEALDCLPNSERHGGRDHMKDEARVLHARIVLLLARDNKAELNQGGRR